jgi:hypothetical protein
VDEQHCQNGYEQRRDHDAVVSRRKSKRLRPTLAFGHQRTARRPTATRRHAQALWGEPRCLICWTFCQSSQNSTENILGFGLTVPEGKPHPLMTLRCLTGQNSNRLPKNISRGGSPPMGSHRHRHQPVVPMTSCLVEATDSHLGHIQRLRNPRQRLPRLLLFASIL